ncbi:TcpQ domain-containing protein [Paraburkholderia azotifigens]|uniref:toxin co-regulated pilus biosynthesis Q family protein n=1 Tax=Paraburkholderia azotifigens TaxID=2057004 RepID=UPI00317B226F
MNVTTKRNDSVRVITRVLAALTLAAVPLWTHAAMDPDQSRVAPPAGDGWQMLSAPTAVPKATLDSVSPSTPPASASGKLSAAPTVASMPPVAAVPTSMVASTAVTPVILPGATGPAPGGALTLAITPQDINLRNSLDRWLQQQGWQLAWKIDDDLPLEFNATFSGDFDSVLTQVMKATNHMRTPTRVCEHTNNVIRVVARAANCQD